MTRMTFRRLACTLLADQPAWIEDENTDLRLSALLLNS